jgi:hypothetical protein
MGSFTSDKAHSQRGRERSLNSCKSSFAYGMDNTLVSTYIIDVMYLEFGVLERTYPCMKHRSELPHLGEISMIFQQKFVFTLKAAMEEFQECVDLSLVQGGIKSYFRKFEVSAGSERGPGFGWVPRGWTSTLRVVLAVFFKLNNLWV